MAQADKWLMLSRRSAEWKLISKAAYVGALRAGHDKYGAEHQMQVTLRHVLHAQPQARGCGTPTWAKDFNNFFALVFELRMTGRL